ncbi:MAG: prepilin-type N-terminal cleavage/methylation domain-containing protein [Candidatus Desulfatibia sp.]|uniref:PilW family protein n=1 Tax=Candidatus Desulfatibia sp. TaxID=3101189 RepID=UPI002F2EC4E6
MKRLVTAGGRGGFTLVELLIAMAIGAVLLTATYELLNTNSKLYYSKENTMVMTQDLRAATDFLIREIRMAGYNPTGASGIGFQNDSDATSIHFTMDIDGDGAITGTNNEDIEYLIYPQNDIQSLGRRTGGNVGLVAEYITGLGLTCVFGIRRRQRDWVYPSVGVAATILVVIHSLVDFSLQIPAVAITYACIMGVACAQSYSSRQNPSS